MSTILIVVIDFMVDTYVKTSKLNMQVFCINCASVKKKQKKKIQGIKTNSIALANPYLSICS